MKMLTLICMAVLAWVSFARESQAQGTLAPLYLFTQGSGSINPFQNGELLVMGHSYEMTAIPNSGYVFSSWQPVNIFTLMTY